LGGRPVARKPGLEKKGTKKKNLIPQQGGVTEEKRRKGGWEGRSAPFCKIRPRLGNSHKEKLKKNQQKGGIGPKKKNFEGRAFLAQEKDQLKIRLKTGWRPGIGVEKESSAEGREKKRK